MGQLPELDRAALPLKEQLCSLEVLVNPALSMEAHIAFVARTAFFPAATSSITLTVLDQGSLALVHDRITAVCSMWGFWFKSHLTHELAG